MSEKLNDLKTKLKEIFQLDRTDLDFGIYRIMNEKNSEITDFLENKLLPQVKETFKDLTDKDKMSIQKELDEAIKQAESLGANSDDLPKVKELKAQLAASVDLSVLENEVYSRLTSFFSRYYDCGDFMSLRRYKKDVYAIPYEGEEVKLHWANSDQYYIKTSENCKDYTFTIGEDKRAVHFKLTDTQTEKDNNKAAKERRFMLTGEKPLEITDNELFIKFCYTACEEKKDQKKCNEETLAILLPELSKGDYANFAGLLSKMPTEKNKDRTLLEKYLTDYTSKNSFDYFIHKDLGGFLNRELDFYIKNEVLNLDDLDENNIKKSLNKAKAIKKIAQKIITLLAQLEEFQKKLWLKKKLVIETNYCITLDKTDERFYPEIINNKLQIEEWEKLFKISEISADKTKLGGDTLLSGGDDNKKIEFLKQNPYLVLDTKFFSQDFKYDLLSTIKNLDEQTNGLLINADNFHALNLLQEKYKKQVKCIYIDPPYNTNGNDFIYKDNYKDASWITMFHNRIKPAYTHLQEDACIVTHIDEFEISNTLKIFEDIFGKDNVEIAIWRKTGRQSNTKHIARMKVTHEYLVFGYKNKSKIEFKKIKEKPRWLTERTNPDNDPRGNYEPGIISKNEDKSKTDSENYYSITLPSGRTITREWYYPKEVFEEFLDDNRIYIPKGGDGVPRLKIFENEENEYYFDSVCDRFGTFTSAKEEVANVLGACPDSLTPKTIKIGKEIIRMLTNANSLIYDIFGGSGTSYISNMLLNNEQEKELFHKINVSSSEERTLKYKKQLAQIDRKFVLVDMGCFFNTLTKPRIQKVIYSKEWKDGKPVGRNGVSQIFKYMSLESYEDALNNLHKKDIQITLGEDVEEQYKLSYMMDFEYSGSIFNLEMFRNPFDYKMNIATGNEIKPVNVDLIETFNWLIGLKVSSIYRQDGFTIVEGSNLKEENILVIWRNIEEKSNEDLDKFLKRRKINHAALKFSKIYVNGDNNLQNLKTNKENFKVMLIEEEFKNRMFDVKDV